ncbi:hypothetical protein [Amycolatopsis sp. NPDC051071]|uniref:hypothetical protein n=1 Tax=Amycolatopsis sp. NPDC051071 TaxID=3154637 RepID=UPI003436C8E4
MTDLETLRSALREEPAEEFAAPDIAAIMTKGKRIRRRRRLVTGAGGVAATVVTVLVIVGAVALREPARQPEALPPAASASSPSPSLSPSSFPASTATTAPPYPRAQPLGDVIPLDVEGEGDRKMVLYATAFDEPTLQDIQFGLNVAYQNDDGTFDGLYMTNETRGSDRSFGFHATGGGTLVRNTFIPVFGYFAGPAVRITSTVRGKPVEARTAVWSEDPSVVIFWFEGSQVQSSNVLTPLTAYDAKGQRLTK